MNRLIALGASAAILAGSYIASFGLPAVGLQGAEGRPEAAGTARSGARGAGRATTVVLRPIEHLPYEDTLRAVGSATALRSVDVISQVGGKVIRADLDANRTVAQGDILIELDARTEALTLQSAQAELRQAQDTVTRFERLRASGTATDVTLSEARIAQQLAEAKVGLAQVALEDRTIRAPIAGRLGLSDVGIGDVLSANTVIATLDDTQALLIEFELPERAIGMLKAGGLIRASTPAFSGKVFEGEITAFDSRLDSVTRSLTVRARIGNPHGQLWPDGQLWPGMTFAVRLSQASAALPVVPASAITWSRDGAQIWVDAGGVARSVPVTILHRRDDQVWIQPQQASDLGPNLGVETLVVSEGAQKLREGAAIVQAGAARGGNAAAADPSAVDPAAAPTKAGERSGARSEAAGTQSRDPA